MDYWYTATETYDNNYEDGSSWAKYIEFSKLTHLTELISLDGMLNGKIFEPDRGEGGDWDHIIVDDLYETGLFNSLDYVLEKVANKERFNLVTIVKEPTEECEKINIPDFDFVGYELLDKDYSTSALSNCGGFDETFKPFDLNHYGLIDTFEKAYDIRERLKKNNPEEHHADCNVLALWRHKTLGRMKNTIVKNGPVKGNVSNETRTTVTVGTTVEEFFTPTTDNKQVSSSPFDVNVKTTNETKTTVR